MFLLSCVWVTMYQLRRGGPDAARNGFPHYRVSRVEGRHERERGLRGMKRAVVPIVILLLLVPILAGCGGEPKGEKPARKDVKDYELRAESAGFGFGLFRQVAAQDPGSNVVLSPVSAKLALAMAYNGAVGDTAQAMANVLDLEGKGLDEVNEQLGNLMVSLEQADEDVLLEIANSLWANEQYGLAPDFAERCRESYDAEVASLDFGDPGSARRINSWVGEKTHEKIDGIVDVIDPDSALMLINAVYFNGKWALPFDPELTVDGDFHLPGGTTVTVPLMHGRDEYSYFENEDVQAVSLPYGEGRMSMCVFLPREGADHGAFLQGLDENVWQAWMDGFYDREGELALPRFKVEYEKVLNDALTAMGMGPAFAGGFTGMTSPECDEELFISTVLQKTYIDVNEEGTEAAAVTSVEMEATAVMPPQEPFEMIVDRPFFFAIRDNQTGALLFVGSITDPS